MLSKTDFDARLLHVPAEYLAARIETTRAFLALCDTMLRHVPHWRAGYWQTAKHEATDDLAEMQAALEILQDSANSRE